ncbi:trypco2 family protein [Streptomyces sp. CRN 30]|uniref:trypco2 family protein n=1 Tax=Streptomyces sp. CRN 30 TaxID=3075613 RepID=UPI002A80F0E8|nr:trypco2 family protein [Streptomyces sp. CRN 30]
MEGKTGTDVVGLELADAITLLRAQVAEAQRRIARPEASSDGADRGVLFTLGEVTLELGLELTRSRGADGALSFHVVSLGGKRERAATATHTISVQLMPHRFDGGDVDVSDEE